MMQNDINQLLSKLHQVSVSHQSLWRPLLDLKNEINLAHLRGEEIEQKLLQRDEEVTLLRDSLQHIFDENKKLIARNEFLEREYAALSDKYGTVKTSFERNTSVLEKLESDINTSTHVFNQKIEDHIRNEKFFNGTQTRHQTASEVL